MTPDDLSELTYLINKLADVASGHAVWTERLALAKPDADGYKGYMRRVREYSNHLQQVRQAIGDLLADIAGRGAK